MLAAVASNPLSLQFASEAWAVDLRSGVSSHHPRPGFNMFQYVPYELPDSADILFYVLLLFGDEGIRIGASAYRCFQVLAIKRFSVARPSLHLLLSSFARL